MGVIGTEVIDTGAKLISETGVTTAVMLLSFAFIFIIIRSYKKTMDDRMAKSDERIDQCLERCNKQNEEYKSLIEKYHDDAIKTTEALAKNTEAFEMLKDVIGKFSSKATKKNEDENDFK